MRDYDALINSLKNCVYIPCDGTQKEKCLAGREDDCRRELMAIAADAIEELSRPKWISVEERLPEEYETVLLLTMSGDVISGYYDSAYKRYCDMTGFRHLCTHWMPLPEPPKETTNDSR